MTASGLVALWMCTGVFVYMIALCYYFFDTRGGPFVHVSNSKWYEGLFAVFFWIFAWPGTVCILLKKVIEKK